MGLDQITGGSSGIGLSLAKFAVRFGANVSIIARDRKKLDEALQSLQKELKDEDQRVEAASGENSSPFAIAKRFVA